VATKGLWFDHRDLQSGPIEFPREKCIEHEKSQGQMEFSPEICCPHCLFAGDGMVPTDHFGTEF